MEEIERERGLASDESFDSQQEHANVYQQQQSTGEAAIDVESALQTQTMVGRRLDCILTPVDGSYSYLIPRSSVINVVVILLGSSWESQAALAG